MRSISTKGMSHEDWLEHRRHGIGGSDIGALLGFSNYTTPRDLYFDKIGEAEPFEGNIRTEAGTRLEPIIAQWWSEINQMRIREDHKILIHDTKDHVRVNVDRMIVSDDDRGPGILECKNTGRYAYQSWCEDGLELNHFSQVQWGMYVTGYQWGALAVLVEGYQIEDFAVERDEDFIKEAADRADDFWHNHVLKKIPPKPANREEFKKIYPSSDPETTLAATVETYNLVREAKQAEQARLAAKKSEDAVKLRLENIIMGKETVTFNGVPILTYKNNKPGEYFDKNAFKEAHPETYKKFATPALGARVLRIKKTVL